MWTTATLGRIPDLETQEDTGRRRSKQIPTEAQGSTGSGDDFWDKIGLGTQGDTGSATTFGTTFKTNSDQTLLTQTSMGSKRNNGNESRGTLVGDDD